MAIFYLTSTAMTLGFLVLQFTAGQTLEIISTISDLTEYDGTNVSMACTVQGKGFDFFYNQIVWYKIVDGDDEDIQINTGAVVNEPFYSTHRYAVEPTVFDSSAEISLPLSITGIQLEDSGTYRCVLYQKQKVLSTVTHSLVVPAPVDQLTLIINTTNKDNNNIKNNNNSSNKTTLSFVAMTTNASSHGAVSYQMEENDRTSVECVTQGRGLVPELRVTLGPSNDVTSTFQRLQTAERKGPRGLDVVVYELRLVAEDFRLNADDEKKHLKCVARFHGHPELTRKAVGTIDVQYAPKFHCAKERMAALGTRYYRLECAVKANPPVAVDDVIWQIGDVNATNVTSGNAYGVFSASAEVDAEQNHQLNVALTIDEVTEPSYRVYGLVASNVLGERYFHLLLRQDAGTRQSSVRADNRNGNADTENDDQINFTTKVIYDSVSIIYAILLPSVAIWLN